MIFVLIFSCVLTPYEIAFGSNSEGENTETEFESYMDYIFDVLFFMDAMITFFAAVLTDDYEIIDDRKEIAKKYLKGWFFIDIVSCIPFGTVSKAIMPYL